MCGICGVTSTNPKHEALGRDALARMHDSIAHRGPDDAGIFHGEGVALGSRRLSIIDLSANGHMPMSTPDGRFTIVYNGEVYNFKDLRAGLEARGHVFRSSTDTEVVLHMFQDYGPRMLDRFNGMFAFAIWDSKEKSLFLARDRVGIKPLYYHVDGATLVFASEVKALLAAGVRAEFDPNRWEELLCFRYVAGGDTPFGGIHRLLPGHWAVWKDGRLAVTRWWNLSKRATEAVGTVGRDPVRWFAETFDDAVQKRLISDVPVGVLLSGGLDSSTIAASLGANGQARLASFTVRFDHTDFDEGPIARDVAHKWGLEIHELKVAPDTLIDGLRKATWFNDEPLVHGNDIHLWAISAHAKPIVTVLLSGEGSDETLGGYVRYQPLRLHHLLRSTRQILPSMVRLLGLGGRARKMARFLSLGTLDRFVLFNSCDVLPTDLQALGFRASSDFRYREAVLDEARALYPREPMRQVMYYDQHTFLCSILDRNDKMTMGASIECRVPFLDYRLVEGLSALGTKALFPDRRTKPLLRRAFGLRLPESVRRHRKWGFGVPWHKYLREVPSLRDLVISIPDCEPVLSGPFDRKKVRAVIKGFLAGDESCYMLIRQLMKIVVWHDQFCRSTTQPAAH